MGNSLDGDVLDVRLMLCLLWFSFGGEGGSTYRFVACLLGFGMGHGWLMCCGNMLIAWGEEQCIEGSQPRSGAMC